MKDKIVNKKFNEAQLEESIIELFIDQGYEYVNGEEIHRKFTDVILEDDLKSFLKANTPRMALVTSRSR